MWSSDLHPAPPLPGPAPLSPATRNLGPRLLVSVRTETEAAEALRGGVNLLDVKDPARGALGPPDPAQVQAILAARDRIAPITPVSVALGELSDWTDSLSLVSAGVLSRVSFAKLGLAGMAASHDWRSRWERLRGELERSANAAPGWVAVIYADWRIARSPAPDEVIAAAAETRCPGVLIDTFCKRSGRLLEHVSPANLHSLSVQVRAAGMFFAAAGQLQSSDLPRLAEVPLDVIAVRSAVCEWGDRQSRFSLSRLEEFQAALQRVFPAEAAQDVTRDHHTRKCRDIANAR